MQQSKKDGPKSSYKVLTLDFKVTESKLVNLNQIDLAGAESEESQLSTQPKQEN